MTQQAAVLPPPPNSQPYYPQQPINQIGQPTSPLPPPPPDPNMGPAPGASYGPGNAGASTPGVNPNVGGGAGGGVTTIGATSGGGGGNVTWGRPTQEYQGNPNDNPAGAATQPSATDVRTGAPGYGDFQRYEQAALDNAMRTLAPQQQAEDESFRQQMLNRGITEGSEAWARARSQFDRRQTDQLDQARFNAMQEGRAAQEQAFQQGLAESGLANQLRRAQIAANAQTGSARIGANASRYNANLANQLGFAQLGEQGRQYDLGLGQRESEFGRRYDLDSLMGMGNLLQGFQGLGLQGQQLQNQFNQQQFNNWMGLLGPGAISPHGVVAIDPNAAAQTGINAGAARAGAIQGAWAPVWDTAGRVLGAPGGG